MARLGTLTAVGVATNPGIVTGPVRAKALTAAGDQRRPKMSA